MCRRLTFQLFSFLPLCVKIPHQTSQLSEESSAQFQRLGKLSISVMCKYFTAVLLVFFCWNSNCAQSTIIEGETILSYDIDNTSDASQRLRFTFFPNLAFPIRLYQLSARYSLGTAVSIRNIGICYKDSLRHRNRSLTVGVPITLSFLINPRSSLQVGGEVEFLYHTKVKTFADNKIKSSEFLSDRVNRFLPSVRVRYTYKSFSFQMRYYLSDYLNRDYVEKSGLTPYVGQQSHIVYISTIWDFYSLKGGDE